MSTERTRWKYALAFENNAPNYYAITVNAFGAPLLAKCFDEDTARKIAAVPDLLEALKHALSRNETHAETLRQLAKNGTESSANMSYADECDRWSNVYRAAIAKATGAA